MKHEITRINPAINEPLHKKICLPGFDQVQHKLDCTATEFWIEEVEGLYYLRSENKGADQLGGSAPLFSHYAKTGFLMTRLKCISILKVYGSYGSHMVVVK